jgi:hypothetical protein
MPPKKGTIKRPDVAERNKARAGKPHVEKRPPPPVIPPARDFSMEGPPLPEPVTEPEQKRLVDDEEAEFVTAEEVKKRWEPNPVIKPEGKTPEQSGFITELVAGLGQKIHETEYGMTGHPVFIHGPADERIWTGLGRYVESQLDPAKYGIVILTVVLVGSELMKIAVWGNDVAKVRKREQREMPNVRHER